MKGFPGERTNFTGMAAMGKQNSCGMTAPTKQNFYSIAAPGKQKSSGITAPGKQKSSGMAVPGKQSPYSMAAPAKRGSRITHCPGIHEPTEFERSGLDAEKLGFMDIGERRAMLIGAGLDPDKYDF